MRLLRAGVVLMVVGVVLWLVGGINYEVDFGAETFWLGGSIAALGFLLISEWWLRR